ncbi:hypothetical protein SY85_22755 [Flavisolibacter tropicus]|uniref:Uncharacterized protein n=1 Tax=Flavisolibacter tropicus TaxID=1492898 RepID=A0A172U0K3_9BACT|nr:hypothetical protein SY85_22755 [Flavisolibacter tropicus]
MGLKYKLISFPKKKLQRVGFAQSEGEKEKDFKISDLKISEAFGFILHAPSHPSVVKAFTVTMNFGTPHL